MQYPSLLTPATIEKIELPSGREIQIPKVNPLFKVWSGKPVSGTYGNKPILRFNNKPAFAEIVILGIFKNVGWNGVWVDTYRNKFRTAYWPKDEVDLPPK